MQFRGKPLFSKTFKSLLLVAGPVSTNHLICVSIFDVRYIANSKRNLKLKKNLSIYNTPVSLGSYLSGYADGEGCFCVSVNKSVRHRLGWEIRPSFSVSQNKDRAEVLTLFMNQFSCGTIRPDSSDNTVKYEIRSLEDLVVVV